MDSYRPGEVILLSFPLANTTGTKRRPALVLLDAGDEDIVLARLTSQIHQTAFDVEIIDWQQASLLLPSVARVHKLATIEKCLVERRLGTLTPNDWKRVRVKIKQLWTSI